MDLFRLNANGSWDRAFEEHRERAWGREELETYLTEAGFGAVTVTGDLTSRPPDFPVSKAGQTKIKQEFVQ